MKTVNHNLTEIVTNLHIHTVYSDGTAKHAKIAEIAGQAGLDALIITDHNVFPKDLGGYYKTGSKNVLVMIGEEIHNRVTLPQKNHLLVIGTDRDLLKFGTDTQELLKQVRQAEGLSFIAHPNDEPLPQFGQSDITWEKWGLEGFTGIELWNGFSELKEVVRGKLTGLFYSLFPEMITRSPHPKTMQKWDELHKKGKRIVGVAGSDAHAMPMSLGPIKKRVLPYQFHFESINNHLLSEEELSGDFEKDQELILHALKHGHNYIGNDLMLSSKGFRFYAQGRQSAAIMGDEINLDTGVTLQIKLPEKADCNLIRDGKIMESWENTDRMTIIVDQSGVYRVETFLRYLGKKRTWIISNPIYIR